MAMDQTIIHQFLVQDLINARYKFLGIVPAASRKIPATLHHIWLTSSHNPRDITKDNIEQTKHILKLLADDLVNHWSVNIWTNDLSAVANAKEALEPFAVKFCDIAELKLNKDETDNINYIIDKQYWGMGSDMLRYIVIDQFGGFYADLGADFYRAPGDDLFRYDFLANQWDGVSAANNFFAAKPGHPALARTREIVEENLKQLRINNMIDSCSIKDQTTELTAEPFNEGFYEYLFNNSGNTTTIDVIIPHSRFHNNKNFHFDNIDLDALPQCSIWEVDIFFDICAADHLFIGQDALVGESWLAEL